MFRFFVLFSIFCVPSSAVGYIDKSECGKSKGCFFKPTNCDPSVNCTVAMSYSVENDNVNFELSAQIRIQLDSSQGQYIALGYSDDESMGDDFVTYCIFVKDDPSKTSVGIGYNEKNVKHNVPIKDLPLDDFLALKENGVVEKTFVCKMKQKIQPHFSSDTQNRVRSLNKPYYIFLVTGTADLKTMSLTVHNTDQGSKWYPAISPNKIDVTSKNFS